MSRQLILIIEICCILAALWPYVCLTYLGELKKIKNELNGIKKELREMNYLKKEEDKQCEDMSTESIG